MSVVQRNARHNHSLFQPRLFNDMVVLNMVYARENDTDSFISLRHSFKSGAGKFRQFDDIFLQ